MKLPDTSYSVIIDYTRSLGEMINASRCDRVNPKITAERFPVTNTKKTPQTLYVVRSHDDLNINSTHSILNDLRRSDVRPANLAELLAFIEYHPKIVPKICPLVALDSSFQKGWFRKQWMVPYADLDTGNVCLRLCDFGGIPRKESGYQGRIIPMWSGSDYFLAAKRETAAAHRAPILQSKFCQACNEFYPDFASFCRRCGEKLETL